MHFLGAPHELDPVVVDARVRLEICEDVRTSELFIETHEKLPLSTQIALTNENSAPYAQREFKLTYFILNENHEYIPRPFKNKEYIFVCWFQNKTTNDVVPLHVSKVYGWRFNRRYIVLEKSFPHETQRVMLAEKPATVYARPDFNVELHYLEVRKHYKSGKR